MRVGQGKLGFNQFLAWQNPEPFTVSSVSFMANAQGHHAEWQVAKRQGTASRSMTVVISVELSTEFMINCIHLSNIH